MGTRSGWYCVKICRVVCAKCATGGDDDAFCHHLAGLGAEDDTERGKYPIRAKSTGNRRKHDEETERGKELRQKIQ